MNGRRMVLPTPPLAISPQNSMTIPQQSTWVVTSICTPVCMATCFLELCAGPLAQLASVLSRVGVIAAGTATVAIPGQSEQRSSSGLWRLTVDTAELHTACKDVLAKPMARFSRYCK